MLSTLPRTLALGSVVLRCHPMGTLTSECAVQQGDPLGPLLFCLVLNILVKDICSDPNCANLSLHSWYLDDGVVAGPSLAVQKVLALIEEKGPPLVYWSTSLNVRCSPPQL